MENHVEKCLETDLRCPYWDLCDSHKCWACVQACAERRARARNREVEQMYYFQEQEKGWEQLSFQL